MLRAVVLTQYRRVTDRQMDRRTDGRTDGIAVANTALAMRALRRAVKKKHAHRQTETDITYYTQPAIIIFFVIFSERRYMLSPVRLSAVVCCL